VQNHAENILRGFVFAFAVKGNPTKTAVDGNTKVR